MAVVNVILASTSNACSIEPVGSSATFALPFTLTLDATRLECFKFEQHRIELRKASRQDYSRMKLEFTLLCETESVTFKVEKGEDGTAELEVIGGGEMRLDSGEKMEVRPVVCVS